MDSRWWASGIREGGNVVYAPASAHHNGSPSLKDSRPHQGESSPGLTSLRPPLIHPQVQCGIFSTIFNPTGERLGNKILRQRLRGLVLTTTLQRDTAHIAQLVVDPAYRRRGLARALVEDASRRAGAAGCWRVTLLVADDNTAARDLYASLGFEPVAHFLHATRQAPNRLRGQRSTKSTVLV